MLAMPSDPNPVARRTTTLRDLRPAGALPALLLAIVAASAPASAQQRFFSPDCYVPYDMGGVGLAAVADLNGDGRPDLIQSNFSGSIVVRLSDGASGFGAQIVTPVAHQLSSVAAGDVTGDGRPDLVGIEAHVPGPPPTADAVILPGLGDGTFGPPQILPVGQPPGRVSIGDVDADGRDDIIVASSGANSITLYRAVPGGFAPRADIATGTYPAVVVVARIDGDLHPDLVVTCYTGNAISLHRGIGGGAFAAPTEIPTVNNPWGLAVSDLDGDADADLVVGNVVTYACCAAACSIYRGNGDGTFAAPTYHGDGSGTYAAVAADFDLDGSPDILALTQTYHPGTQHLVTLLRGADAWSSAGQTFHPAGGGPDFLMAVDMDADGRREAVVGGGQPYIVVYRGSPGGPLGPWSTVPFGMRPGTVAIADLNDDTRSDLFAGDRFGPIGVRLGNGDGSFGPVAHSGDGMWAPRLADLDADGTLDVVGLVVIGIGENGIGTMRGNGDGTFSGGTTFASGLGPTGVAVGDLNEDGLADLVVTSRGNEFGPPPGEISVHLGTGDGNFAPRMAFSEGFWYLPVLHDFNHDGHLDLMTSGVVFLGLGDGTLEPSPAGGLGMAVTDLATGLFDFDVIPDIVVGGPGGLFVMPGLGNGGFGVPLYVNSSESVEGVRVGDVDGDGHADVVWVTPGTVHVMRGLGGAAFAAPVHYVACGTGIVEPTGDVAAIGDLNGDARPDLAFECWQNGSVATLLNTHPGYPTPVLVAFAGIEALPGLVRLAWHGVGAGELVATVERRTATTGWRELGAPEIVGADRLRFEDRTVQPAERYAYRLVVRAGGPLGPGEELWVTIPAEASFALHGVRPQPGGRELAVHLSLATDEPAALELLDVAGRRMRHREIGGLGPGAHIVPLAEGRSLAAGVYMLRLIQGSRTATIKAVVTP